MLLLAGAFAFTSCSDDNESNPTISQPTQFVLNKPADANGNVDLAKSTSIILTWSQPTPYTDYNAPLVPTYTVELSSAGTFNQKFDANLDDNTGADYISLDETYSSGLEAKVNTETLNKALLQLNGWDDTTIPASFTLSIRIKSAIRDASFREYNVIYSNVVTMKIIPYYTELKPADPEIWYMTGAIIADGSWSNDPEKVGTGMMPMYVKPGFEYDKKTGKGIIEYAGYFPEGEFKIIAPEGLSNWNYGLCGGTEAGGQVYRDGGDDPGNIKITAAGYYKLTLNTENHELTWETLDAATTYTQIAMPGSYQSGDGWDVNSNLLDAVTTGSENHDWFTTITIGSDAELKFAANGGWDYNWGDSAFPYGTGTQNGPNIPVLAGTYKVYFNDILGTYMFVSQE